MPKSLVVDPTEVRASGAAITSPGLPVNQYRRDFSAEIDHYGGDELTAMLRDMIVIREFESMLNAAKTVGEYHGTHYAHAGPAHLGIGQEAAYVGQAAALDVEDMVFGSHRSHGEILAKCLSATRKLDSSRLERTMEDFLGGETLRLSEKISHADLRELAVNFVLFGTLAEIFARKAGFNRGMGGSMHGFFAPFGSMPNNAIVGGSAPIAMGAALFKRINRRPGIVVANIGDASLGCGPVWEAMNFAAMGQFRTLWRDADGGNPPVLFNIFNNFYGMGSQTAGETMGYDSAARVAMGVNPAAMHAERVDGYDPLAVADAIRRKRPVLLSGEGPVLLDTVTYRIIGHAPTDPGTYRTKEEVGLWHAQDCIASFAQQLQDAAILTAAQYDQMGEQVVAKLAETFRLASDLEQAPRADAAFIESVMLSNQRTGPLSGETPELILPIEDSPRSRANASKPRSARNPDGSPISKARAFQYRDAVYEAMAHGFATEPTMAAWGEEVRDWGGPFGVTRGLTEVLPYRRMFNSPISEASIVGGAVGYAISGGRAVVELMYNDFLGRCGDEVFNQMAKWQSMSAGLLRMPLTLRITVGDKFGAQHSQDWSAMVAHVPGLKVYCPATPADAKGMLNLALAGSDPVVFIESRALYDYSEHFEKGGVPVGYYETAEGQPAVRRAGADLTIATYGPALYRAIQAADILEARHGLSTEVIDLRFMVPLDYTILLDSVRKTGRLLLCSDAVERGSFLNTVATRVQSAVFDYLDAPVTVVGSRNHIVPAAELEELFYAQPQTIIDTIHEHILPLPGHRPTSNQACDELLRRDRLGV